MPLFDPYTRNFLCSILTEQTLPPANKSKEDAVTVDKQTGKRYVFKSGAWREWPKGQKKPSFQGLDVTPNEAMFGREDVPKGYDPYSQAAWANYYDVLKGVIEGMTAGSYGSMISGGMGGIGKGIDFIMGAAGKKPGGIGATEILGGAGNVAGGLISTLGGPAKFVIDRAIKNAYAKAYTGEAADFLSALDFELKGEEAKGDESTNAMIKGIKGIVSFLPGIEDIQRSAGKDRLGAMGKRIAGGDRFTKMSLANMDPAEYALTAGGARKASETIPAAGGAASSIGVESAGGALQQLRKMGIIP
jgi:hypothetical protein